MKKLSVLALMASAFAFGVALTMWMNEREKAEIVSKAASIGESRYVYDASGLLLHGTFKKVKQPSAVQAGFKSAQKTAYGYFQVTIEISDSVMTIKKDKVFEKSKYGPEDRYNSETFTIIGSDWARIWPLFEQANILCHEDFR